MRTPQSGLRIVFGSLILAGLCFFAGCSGDDEPKIEARESLYINEIYPAAGEDWIELYNDTDAEKNIGGYKIYDDGLNKFTLPANTKIAARGYLVIVCDDTGSGLSANFKLSASGETVYLENSQNKLVDKVLFPAMDDGQSYGRYPDGSDQFLISGSATRGTSNGDQGATLLGNVTRTPLVPALADPVTVKVTILNSTDISSVKLFYRLNSAAFSSADMTKSGTEYSATIPAMNTTGTVTYYIEVTKAGRVSRSPFDAPDKLYSYLLNTDPLPLLKLNEFLAVNISCCPDTDGGVQEFDDWIEIYNAGSSPVDLADFYLSDDLSNPFNSRIKTTNAAKTTIPAGGFVVVWADGTRAQGELHLDFALSADGEAIGLYYKDGRTIDTFTFGPQTANVSMGREANGGGVWKTFAVPTPGQTNE